MKKFVIALMVAATSAFALAQTAGTGTFHGHGQRAGFHKFGAKLNLTDAQKQQLKDIRTADRASNKQLYADFHTKLQQFRALKKANDPGAAGVKEQLETMKPQLQAARKASHEAMLNVLTPEQREQLKDARGSHRSGRGAGRGMRGVAAQKLNLTDEQKVQLKQLRETSQQQNAQLFADAQAKRQELRSLTRKNDPRASDVKAEIEALRPQLEAARQKQHEGFLSVLTPEQKSQLEQWKAQRQSRRESR